MFAGPEKFDVPPEQIAASPEIVHGGAGLIVTGTAQFVTIPDELFNVTVTVYDPLLAYVMLVFALVGLAMVTPVDGETLHEYVSAPDAIGIL